MNEVVKYQGGASVPASRGSSGASPHPLRLLSPAQRRVLALIGAGKMTKEIAAEMHLSEKGVEYHRGVIYRVLGIQSVGEAVRVAVENQI